MKVKRDEGKEGNTEKEKGKRGACREEERERVEERVG